MIYTSEEDIQRALTKPQPTAKALPPIPVPGQPGKFHYPAISAHVVVNREKGFAKYCCSANPGGIVSESTWDRFVAANWSAAELRITEQQHVAMAANTGS